MNRELNSQLLLAVAGAFLAAPAAGQEPPKVPSVAIDAIEARNLLAPIEEARAKPGYRLDPGLGVAYGQRARVSMDVGDATVFAITGRLVRQPGPPGPLDLGHAKALGLGRPEAGKVYGGGVNRSFGGVDVSATYQYSKLRDEQPGADSQARDNGPGKSHSLRGTVRIRFRP